MVIRLILIRHLELVGNVVQVGVGAAQYAQIGDFNASFNQAMNAAQQPVTVADLTALMQSDAGQTRMYTYLAAMLATGGKTESVMPTTHSLAEIEGK